MKKFAFIALLTTIAGRAGAQSSYYGSIYLNGVDTVFLSKVINMERQKDSEITSVIYYSQNEKAQLGYLDTFLRRPFSHHVGTLDYNVIQAAFDKYYQSGKIQLLYDLDISAQPTKVLAFGLQPFNSVTPAVQYETNLAETGIHYYSATPFRPKQTADYMNTLRDAARTVGELQIFFPETFDKMRYSNSSQFPDFGDSYKKIFSEDLENVFSNMFNYIENYPQNAVPDIECTFLKEKTVTSIKNSDYYFPLKFTVELFDKVTSGYNPVSLLNYLDKKYYVAAAMSQSKRTTKEKMGVALHGMNLIQSALRDTASAAKRKANIWISFEQLNALNDAEKKYFLGLVYQKDATYFDKMFNFTAKTTDSGIMATLDPYVSSVLEQLTALQEFVNAGSAKGKKGNYLRFLNLNYNLVMSNPFLPQEVKPYFANTGDLLYIYDNVHNHTYGTSLYYTLKILNGLQQSKQEFSREMRVVETYAGFLSDIVNANNSEQLQAVLEKYIPKK